MNDPLTVPCPACNQPPGCPCLESSAYEPAPFGVERPMRPAVYIPRRPHIKRRELAAKAAA